jgi:peptide chain release factor 3
MSLSVPSDPQVAQEAAIRRTFAIISHPDAGKTTLTEKLLLYSGQVAIAGMVRGRKSQRAATSDFLEMERQRGISVTSSALTFDYGGCRINLLDTPGHQDFSEDTYRTLMAADSAVMVIDLAKGVEEQTIKLFRVCAMRKIPIMTFVNKVDRPGRDPLEVMAEVEKVLGIEAVAYNWPIGTYQDFRGVYNVVDDVATIFARGQGGEHRLQSRTVKLKEQSDPDVPADLRSRVLDEVELVMSAGSPFEQERFARGEQTPVFFGSALNNFGVQDFLEAFVRLAPPPTPRMSDAGPVPIDSPNFSGFVFKIQANLDPRHRDRIAFVRVCAGKFVREMEVHHPRTGKTQRIRRSHRLFANDRETVDEAFPGDVIGLTNPGEFRLGDTLCVGPVVNYEPLPRFAAEHFCSLRCDDTQRRKQFEAGLEQLAQEGAVQVFHMSGGHRRETILAVVGELQFDVIRFRLEHEYGVQTIMNRLSHTMARWVAGPDEAIDDMHVPSGCRKLVDVDGKTTILFNSIYDLNFCKNQNPKLEFLETSDGGVIAKAGR